jgi:hypothetical protein
LVVKRAHGQWLRRDTSRAHQPRADRQHDDDAVAEAVRQHDWRASAANLVKPTAAARQPITPVAIIADCN